MNTLDIERVSQDEKTCRGLFQGVISIDTVPPDPRLLVCNTDPSDRPGKHWFSIYVDSLGHGEFFDSFGQKPSRAFEDYMNRYCRTRIFNTAQLQSISSAAVVTAAFTVVFIACLDVDVSI
jgi:hypothetical protein